MEHTEITPISSVFAKLRSLTGQWKDVNSTTLVEFRESANGSILVETWTWPEKGIEALTIYYLDGEVLFATHYCPLGNQPTLKFMPTSNKRRIGFHYASATNLPIKQADHCESFWFELSDKNKFVRSESYLDNGTLDTTQSTYQRIL